MLPLDQFSHPPSGLAPWAAAPPGVMLGPPRKPLSLMVADLLLALGLPLALLLLGLWLLLQRAEPGPAWLERMRRHKALIWNTGIGLIIALSALRWLLGR